MPFTFSHAAAGLPFRKWHLAWSAFFIGSFAPDFEYFLRLAPQTAYGHRWPGMLTFALPAALLAFVLYELFVRETLVAMLPQRAHLRIPPPDPHYDARRVLLVIGSCALGIATHIFWDGLTHEDYWGAQLFPILLHPVTFPFFGSRSLAHLLQWISSILGLLAIALWARTWISAAPTAFRIRSQHPVRLRIYALLAAAVALGFAVTRASEFAPPISADTDTLGRRFIVLVTVDVIGLLWWFLVAAGIFRKLFPKPASSA